MEKFFSNLAGFRAWFILQHLHGYKPFLTKITFECTFQENLGRGRDQRVNERRELKEQEDRLWQLGQKNLENTNKIFYNEIYTYIIFYISGYSVAQTHQTILVNTYFCH